MPAVVDPMTGLQLFELSHRWGYNVPTWPGYEDVRIERLTTHAKHGVLTQKIVTVMHSSTHVNAPIHLIPGAPYVGELPLDTFFGNGVVVAVPREKWELITPADLENARPTIQAGDIVIINTGWHERYSDSQEYFGYAPGLSRAAAEWLIEQRVKLVGIDTAAIDHPLATSLGPHRNGPQIKYLIPEYKKTTGRAALGDFPEWNPAHRALLSRGIPTIENVGGDVDELSGRRCTFHAYPWRWKEGDACVIRLVAILDPSGAYRLEPGAALKPGLQPTPRATGADGPEFYDLSHRWGHGIPQWPSRSMLNIRTLEFHAKDGVLVQQFEGIMHRGTHMDAPIHVAENTPTITGYALWRFFGTGVAVSIPKKKWEVITPDDLENAHPKIEKGDIVMINTGSHHNWGDHPDYFAYSPGLYKGAAEWLVERQVKLVGIDVQALDHPLGTFLGPHGPGPAQPHLNDEYTALTGREILEDFPYWEPAHKILTGHGIPGIENVGGDLDQVTGKRCTFMAFPWRWTEGDGCGIRVVAVVDPRQQFRIETGR